MNPCLEIVYILWYFHSNPPYLVNIRYYMYTYVNRFDLNYLNFLPEEEISSISNYSINVNLWNKYCLLGFHLVKYICNPINCIRGTLWVKILTFIRKNMMTR